MTETLTATLDNAQGSADNPAPTISTATAAADITDNDDNWLDPPEFGDWTKITDPDYTAASYRTDI